MSLTRTRLITTTALATVLIAGCGGSEPTAATPAAPSAAPSAAARPAAPPSATPSKPAASIAGLSAQQIMKRTKAAAKAAVSVRARGRYTADDGTPVKLDVSLARTASAGTISANGVSVKFLVIGRTAYLQFSDAFWRQNAKPKTDADLLIQLTRDKWIKVAGTDKGFSDLAFLASKPAFVSAMLDHSGDRGRKIGTRTIGGIACIGLARDHRTLWVDATNARPIRLDTPGRSGTESLTFSEYNQIKEPKAPPAAQVVDGRAFGLTGGRQAAGVQGAGLAGELPVRRNNEVEEVRSLMAPPLERLEIYAVSTAVSNLRCTGSAEQRITVLRRLMCDTRPSTDLRHRS